MVTCQECRRSVRGPLHRTATGHRTCDDCNTRLLGAAAGVMASGAGSGVDPVPSAISTSGWLARIRAARRKRPGG